MEEYIVKVYTPIELQKSLNQWKHKYNIDIITIVPIDKNEIIAVIKRVKKEWVK